MHTWANAAGGVSLCTSSTQLRRALATANRLASMTMSRRRIFTSPILDEFFGNMYPELRKNRYVISGESYAGVLVPTLAERILSAEALALTSRRTAWKVSRPVPAWRLNSGALRHRRDVAMVPLTHWLIPRRLGNDCPGNKVYTCTPYSGWAGTKIALDFLYGHGMIPDIIKERVDEVCADWYASSRPARRHRHRRQCAHALEDPIRPLKSIAGDTRTWAVGISLRHMRGGSAGAERRRRRARHLQTTQRRSRASTQGRAPIAADY